MLYSQSSLVPDSIRRRIASTPYPFLVGVAGCPGTGECTLRQASFRSVRTYLRGRLCDSRPFPAVVGISIPQCINGRQLPRRWRVGNNPPHCSHCRRSRVSGCSARQVRAGPERTLSYCRDDDLVRPRARRHRLFFPRGTVPPCSSSSMRDPRELHSHGKSCNSSSLCSKCNWRRGDLERGTRRLALAHQCARADRRFCRIFSFSPLTTPSTDSADLMATTPTAANINVRTTSPNHLPSSHR